MDIYYVKYWGSVGWLVFSIENIVLKRNIDLWHKIQVNKQYFALMINNTRILMLILLKRWMTRVYRQNIICIFNKIYVLIGKMLYIIGSQLFVSYKKKFLKQHICVHITEWNISVIKGTATISYSLKHHRWSNTVKTQSYL